MINLASIWLSFPSLSTTVVTESLPINFTAVTAVSKCTGIPLLINLSDIEESKSARGTCHVQFQPSEN